MLSPAFSLLELLSAKRTVRARGADTARCCLGRNTDSCLMQDTDFSRPCLRTSGLGLSQSLCFGQTSSSL